MSKPKISCAKEKSEAHKKLVNDSYKPIDNTHIGKLYAKVAGGILYRAIIDQFGRVRYYTSRKATTNDKQLYI